MKTNTNLLPRSLKLTSLTCDLTVIGGGISGVCAAITAARAGLKVVLIQDRPVLGGNASSEVRLWILGATSHMGNNNRWAREGGVIDELLVENMFRNPEGNPIILDTLLLEKVVSEPNIKLLLNTAVHDLEMADADEIRNTLASALKKLVCPLNKIRLVRAFNPQNSTVYEVTSPYFCDASGDGIVGFMAGAAFRMGAEARTEFGEKFAAEKATNELLGHTIYFYSKDTGRSVKFVAPSFALKDISKIPRFRDIKAGDYGCRFWWFEWGGLFDTVHETETIKWELWKVVYGVWDYIKNSGKFPEAETLTLEWVGTIPGKRESRRFEGEYMLTQQDIVEQRIFDDAVSFGGWAIDLHPADGVYSAQPGCTQWHSKGVYQIPYRCLFSKNIGNLFLAGRNISASHIAFGSTRVMATCGHNAQVVGIAAAQCLREQLEPRDLLEPSRLKDLQASLLRSGQFIPQVPLVDKNDIARQATITASSELKLASLEPCGETYPLKESWAMMLPVAAGPMPELEFIFDVSAPTTLHAELRVSSKLNNHTPDTVLSKQELFLKPGSSQKVVLLFESVINEARYVFVTFLKNEDVAVYLSDQRVTGVLSVCHNLNKAVAKSATQNPPPDIGIDFFEYWTPKRRPAGKNLAMRINPPLELFNASNLVNGYGRPSNQPNAWVADFAHEQPVIRLTWDEQKTISQIELVFDTDYDHPMESVLMGHPERVMPFCVRNLAVLDVARSSVQKLKQAVLADGSKPKTEFFIRNGGKLPAEEDVFLAEIIDNHQTRQVIRFKSPVQTNHLEIRLLAPTANVPAALFEVRCYGVTE